MNEDSRYYNLASGIDQQTLADHRRVGDGIELPGELIDFYKAQNVNYEPVTAPFSFRINNWDYDLISFASIGKEWQGIQWLNDGGAGAEGLTDDYDKRVQATDYSNPAWIPIASGKNGDYLLYDTDPSERGAFGQIIELQNESWSRVVVAKSLKDLVHGEMELIEKLGRERFDFILGNR